jgi:hypothetical protein
MDSTKLIVIFIGICLLAIIAIFVILTSIKRTGNKKEAEEFLQGLSDRIRDIILEIIRTFDPSEIKDISEDTIVKIETAILEKIYNVCWGYVKDKVENELNKNPDFFTQAVLALLENKDFVEKFIQDIINGDGYYGELIHSKAENIKKVVIENQNEQIEKVDKELEKEFSDQDKYFEEVTEDDLSVGEFKEEPTEEELSKLNPQVDEPEDLDPENDPSVELINDDIYFDKSGRARSKKTGKWTKLNK